jgi:ParB family transcriptional regulator, chromosome partitioning protein
MEEKERLRFVPINLIEINPQNPRQIFDQEKLDLLIESIKQRGEILVPLNVYIGENKKYIIIDGERRYRAALRLGIDNIPVIIREHPEKTEYITDMFHIHHMREPWELVPTSIKLKEIIDSFYKKYKKNPKEEDLIKKTGLNRAEIRRCKVIISFPEEIQDIMLSEEARTSIEKKKIGKERILSEDFFIEIDKNIVKPLQNSNNTLFKDLGGELKIMKSLIKKRREGYVKNIVAFRPISKFIKSNPRKSQEAIKKFLSEETYSLENLLEDTGLEFDIYKFSRNLKVFLGALNNIPSELSEERKKELLTNLRKIKKIVTNKLRDLS